MKVKTVIISVVVSASLVAGVGYGAYYAIRGKATPVEVVPVANVNQYYGWGDEDGNTVYGTITSQVAQTVSLNQDYQVADIYVQEGQKVKEGEALFSYDMTLPELELEMAKLNLQTQELTMVRLEKDLEKLKKSKVCRLLWSLCSRRLRLRLTRRWPMRLWMIRLQTIRGLRRMVRLSKRRRQRAAVRLMLRQMEDLP